MSTRATAVSNLMVNEMTTKEELLQALEQIPESDPEKVLSFVRSLQPSSDRSDADLFWQAYLHSRQERAEVYRRLANS
ncbi:hypothetical protein KR51_00015800 [Rubidibacter lacunae KORDI 51-2]|uniref:Uncharacterized protein n=1 Tax=Rubidibacter lacunae KORDI 51-2 TaxID=582515 RepID=U5DB11_9CHRO|nr:hypothetical protein [Rubidibacter lacunae]ERN41733.1 hypothetical protein KR51_00015800 [Rubidibacter lacunae KORDI 51-2]